MAWERKWAERAFLKALSCSPSSDSFLPTLLLTPSFPTSPPPLPLGCRCRRWPGSHSTWGSSTVPFPAGELEQVPACTGFDPGFPVCEWRVLSGSSGAHGLAQGTRTGTRVAGHKQAGADWGPRLPGGKQHADACRSRLRPAPPLALVAGVRGQSPRGSPVGAGTTGEKCPAPHRTECLLQARGGEDGSCTPVTTAGLRPHQGPEGRPWGAGCSPGRPYRGAWVTRDSGSPGRGHLCARQRHCCLSTSSREKPGLHVTGNGTSSASHGFFALYVL